MEYKWLPVNMNGATLLLPYRRRRVGAGILIIFNHYLNVIILLYLDYLIDCSIINICLLAKTSLC